MFPVQIIAFERKGKSLFADFSFWSDFSIKLFIHNKVDDDFIKTKHRIQFCRNRNRALILPRSPLCLSQEIIKSEISKFHFFKISRYQLFLNVNYMAYNNATSTI